MQDPDKDPLDDDQDEPAPSKPQQAKKLTLRSGIGILALGLIVTLVGASQLAGGAPVYGSVGGVVHQAGLVIMFLGTITLLIGYRIPWFVALMDRHTRSQDTPQTPDAASNLGPLARQPDPSAPRDTRRGDLPQLWLANSVLIGATLVLFLISALFVMLTPRGISAIAALTITTFAFLACLTGLVYGRGYQRTFCLGAIIVMAPVFTQWCLVLVFSISRVTSGGPSRYYGYSAPLIGQIRDMIMLLGMSGSSIRVFMIIMWAAAIVLGLLAVGLRFGLESLNRRIGA